MQGMARLSDPAVKCRLDQAVPFSQGLAGAATGRAAGGPTVRWPGRSLHVVDGTLIQGFVQECPRSAPNHHLRRCVVVRTEQPGRQTAAQPTKLVTHRSPVRPKSGSYVRKYIIDHEYTPSVFGMQVQIG